MAQMVRAEGKRPSLTLQDAHFKKMEQDGELIDAQMYAELDDDAKAAYEEVDIFEEATGKGWGMRYRRRSPLEMQAERKEMPEAPYADMFDTEAEAAEAASRLGCSGTHMAGAKFMPCATHDEWMALSNNTVDAEAVAAPASTDGMMMDSIQKADDMFLCGAKRMMVKAPCEFCRGGCAPEDGMPGLADVEAKVLATHTDAIVLNSGYSSADDIFVVDIKRADGSAVEVFISGDGEELGWLRLSEKSLNQEGFLASIISKGDAEAAAVKTVSFANPDVEFNIMGVMVDMFDNQDVYVVELETESKSYDVFVAVDGNVLGYDEYTLDDPSDTFAQSEADEIKALEAELSIKRLYSRERRQAMADSGEAMEDGSFPIADEADLSNAIQAHGRAKDIEAAKKHIIKRAKELGLEDMLPVEWQSEQMSASTEKGLDSEMLEAMKEFQALLEETEVKSSESVDGSISDDELLLALEEFINLSNE